MHSVTDESIWELFDTAWASNEGGLEAYLQTVVDRCSAWFEADGVSLFLQIEGSDTFLLAAQSGIDASLPWSATFSKGESIAGTVALTGNALLIEDPARHPALSRAGMRARRDLGTAIVAPLMTPEGSSIGVLNISRRAGSPPFDSMDLRRVVQLAGHVALAVANAQLLKRLEAESERHRSAAANSKAVLTGLNSAVLVVDGSGRVVEANRDAGKLLGTRKPVVGMRWEELGERLSEGLFAALRRCALSGAKGVRRKVAVAVDGRHYSVSVSPVAGGGAALLIEDVTLRVEGERELARVRRLAEIGQMTAAIAHEIRNPLTSIRGAAQMLESETKMEACRAWGKVIEEETASLNALCDQFLDFAKPVGLSLQPVSLSAVVQHLAELMRPEIEAANATLHLVFEPEMPTIEADGERLSQALRNLIRNALEAMPNGGTLTLAAGTRGKSAFVAVTDTGMGIDKDNLPKLFTPFFTTRASGTGLGLCNVMRVAEAHGGTVEVESTKAGSTFRLLIPTGGRS